MADAKVPEPVDGQPGAEQTPEYNEALRQQLLRDRENYKNFPDQVAAVDARLAELGEPAAAGATGYDEMTREALYAEVQKRGIEGMSAANKDELKATLEADDRGEVPVEEG